jgi:putative membrane protein
MLTDIITADVIAQSADHWDRPGWWPIFPIAWFLIIAGIIALVAFNARRRSLESGTRAGERRLAERYADGAIDEDEYRTRRAVLRSNHNKP